MKTYDPYETVSECARNAGFSAAHIYQKRYKTLPCRAPIHPATVYRDTGWDGWKEFLGKTISSYDEVQHAAIHAGCTTVVDYKRMYKELPVNAPSAPNLIYDEWTSWKEFLSSDFDSYDDVHQQVLNLGIATARDYWEQYKTLNCNAPSRPYNVYEEWTSWDDFLGNAV